MRFVIALFASLLLISGCGRNYAVHVYSGVDPTIKPSKQDHIFLARPTDASIRERQTEGLIRKALERNGFLLSNEPASAKWILSFAVDRDTYIVGAETKGLAVPLFGGAIAVGRSSTTYKKQTNVGIFMHLFSSADVGKEKPMLFWEGAMTATENVYRAFPDASIKAVIDKFGQDHDRPVRIDKAYQKAAN